MDIDQIKKAEAKVVVARMRVLACSQRDMAAAASRQSLTPIYPGQESVCLRKAAMVAAIASKTDAAADLIEARAGL